MATERPCSSNVVLSELYYEQRYQIYDILIGRVVYNNTILYINFNNYYCSIELYVYILCVKYSFI